MTLQRLSPSHHLSGRDPAGARCAPQTTRVVGGLRLGRRGLRRSRARERSFANGGCDRHVDDRGIDDRHHALLDAENRTAGSEGVAAIVGRGYLVWRLIRRGTTMMLHTRVARRLRIVILHGARGIHARHAQMEHRDGQQRCDNSPDHVSQSRELGRKWKYMANAAVRSRWTRAN